MKQLWRTMFQSNFQVKSVPIQGAPNVGYASVFERFSGFELSLFRGRVHLPPTAATHRVLRERKPLSS